MRPKHEWMLDWKLPLYSIASGSRDYGNAVNHQGGSTSITEWRLSSTSYVVRCLSNAARLRILQIQLRISKSIKSGRNDSMLPSLPFLASSDLDIPKSACT